MSVGRGKEKPCCRGSVPLLILPHRVLELITILTLSPGFPGAPLGRLGASSLLMSLQTGGVGGGWGEVTHTDVGRCLAHSWRSINARRIASNLCPLNQPPKKGHIGQTDVVQVSLGPEVPKGARLPLGPVLLGRLQIFSASPAPTVATPGALEKAPWATALPASPPASTSRAAGS